ncbi:hypothetical protein [Parabacteroides goldsteinii]|uniref:hypothetical protein n=1 Tax=Parabacteroides goldsteinii TaxID=328812 RepID=UPI002165EA8E|nr:hypothetical protein [Parabacteroides goldsteinii]MCS2429329.1 hypothetical protein [Parabacteroides goldsteinii]
MTKTEIFTHQLSVPYLYRKDCPDVLYSYQEQLLLESEVYARGIGVTKDLAKANELFQAGVQAACNYYKADTEATKTFLSKLPDLSKLSESGSSLRNSYATVD